MRGTVDEVMMHLWHKHCLVGCGTSLTNLTNLTSLTRLTGQHSERGADTTISNEVECNEREGRFLKKTSLSHAPHARWLLPASAAQLVAVVHVFNAASQAYSDNYLPTIRP